ncbi:hypothetical protein NDU88_010013 [Pleurodeles waltl]|uniref:CTCK domain-containing protein n=1 Tax=Pleurodeles waltl TaxID=8319 RepID=A0AAV7PTY2_PLEWA|nr:hypothetical protein NDU88_010013 [Pleurodeles waltl]
MIVCAKSVLPLQSVSLDGQGKRWSTLITVASHTPVNRRARRKDKFQSLLKAPGKTNAALSMTANAKDAPQSWSARTGITESRPSTLRGSVVLNSSVSQCEGVTCSSPPQCTKMGEKLVPHGKTKDNCCDMYECECEECHPAPDCPTGYDRIERFNPDEQCCPQYICRNALESPAPHPHSAQRGGQLQSARKVQGRTTAVLTLYANVNPALCLPNVLLDFSEKANSILTLSVVPHISVCYGVTCAPPPQCTKVGQTLVRQEGSGDDCCPDEECECGICLPAPDCSHGYHRETFFNPETECCPRYTCGKHSAKLYSRTPVAEGQKDRAVELTTPEPVTTVPTTTPDVCEGVTCREPPQCWKTGETVVSYFGEDPCCETHSCECNPCGPAPDCPVGTQREEVFDPETECCPNYFCGFSYSASRSDHRMNWESNDILLIETFSACPLQCIGVLCPEPPQCQKNGQIAVPMDGLWEDGSGEDKCCPEFVCVCEPCSPAPVCPSGMKRKAIFHEETDCCPHYICEPPCTDVICKPPPTCTRTGEVPVAIPGEGSGSGSGSGEQECCTDYICECQECSPAPACPVGFHRITWVDPEVECCPHYRCVCELCAPAPTCEEGYRREVVPGPESVCCPRYICVPETTTTPETPRPPPTTTVGPCQGVICSSPPQCNKFGEVPVEHWSGECCPHYTCECKQDCSPPQCDRGYTLKSFSDEKHCCPQYICEPPCFGVKCPDAPTCHRIGETAVKVEGSGQDDECCPEYECECHKCAPEPDCPAGFHMTMSFNPETECCPHYTCDPPCLGVTCPEPPKCKKIGEIAIIYEGSGHDACCHDYECVCLPCASAPDCTPGYIAEPIADSEERRCCPQYKCVPIPTIPPTIPPTTTPFCAHVTCGAITCKPNERLVEQPKPPQACCPIFECEPIPVTPGSTLPPPVTTPFCNHVTCTVKACKPHEKLVQRPTPPQACCPIYDCECQCDSVPTCESDERLVPVHQVNQCCPRLKCEKKKDECHTVPKAVQLIHGECEATVQLQSCSGYCHSSTGYSHRWEPEPNCQCCSVQRTHTKKFEIPCPNGKKTTMLVKEAVACSCQSCSGEVDGSGDESGDSSKEQSSTSSEEQSSTSSKKHKKLVKSHPLLRKIMKNTFKV